MVQRSGKSVQKVAARSDFLRASLVGTGLLTTGIFNREGAAGSGIAQGVGDTLGSWTGIGAAAAEGAATGLTLGGAAVTGLAVAKGALVANLGYKTYRRLRGKSGEQAGLRQEMEAQFRAQEEQRAEKYVGIVRGAAGRFERVFGHVSSKTTDLMSQLEHTIEQSQVAINAMTQQKKQYAIDMKMRKEMRKACDKATLGGKIKAKVKQPFSWGRERIGKGLHNSWLRIGAINPDDMTEKMYDRAITNYQAVKKKAGDRLQEVSDKVKNQINSPQKAYDYIVTNLGIDIDTVRQLVPEYHANGENSALGKMMQKALDDGQIIASTKSVLEQSLNSLKASPVADRSAAADRHKRNMEAINAFGESSEVAQDVRKQLKSMPVGSILTLSWDAKKANNATRLPSYVRVASLTNDQLVIEDALYSRRRQWTIDLKTAQVTDVNGHHIPLSALTKIDITRKNIPGEQTTSETKKPQIKPEGRPAQNLKEAPVFLQQGIDPDIRTMIENNTFTQQGEILEQKLRNVNKQHAQSAFGGEVMYMSPQSETRGLHLVILKDDQGHLFYDLVDQATHERLRISTDKRHIKPEGVNFSYQYEATSEEKAA